MLKQIFPKDKKKELRDLIVQNGLNPDDFKSVDSTELGYPTVRIELADIADFYFETRTQSHGDARRFDFKFSTYRPDGLTIKFVSNNRTLWTSFDDVAKKFAMWIESEAKRYLMHKAEVDDDERKPDVWSIFQRANDNVMDAAVLTNDPLTEKEQVAIAETLHVTVNAIEREVLLTSTQVFQLKSVVEEIKQASKRLGKKDFLTFVLGALVQSIGNLGLTPEVMAKAGQLASQALHFIAQTALRVLPS